MKAKSKTQKFHSLGRPCGQPVLGWKIKPKAWWPEIGSQKPPHPPKPPEPTSTVVGLRLF